MTIDEAIYALNQVGYLCEKVPAENPQQLHVRTKPNGLPSRLAISWLHTVSDRSVQRLVNKRRKK